MLNKTKGRTKDEKKKKWDEEKRQLLSIPPESKLSLPHKLELFTICKLELHLEISCLLTSKEGGVFISFTNGITQAARRRITAP